MTAAGQPLAHRRIRAPREHGQALIDPPRSEVAAMLAANRQLSRGKYFTDSFIAQARRDLIRAAADYTRQYRDIGEFPAASAPIVMAGHQPELFHAGVWFKNFLLSSLATDHGATAINLVVDNDTVDSPAIRVPTGSRQSPRVETLAFDAAGQGIPFEQRAIQDAALFDSFSQRVGEALRPRIADPVIAELWPQAVQARRSTGNLGRALARARHVLEGQWGLDTLEVPLSIICSQPSFRVFALARLWNADDLRRDYNAVLQEYRAVNHIRSRAHPVPDLATDGEWCETPFWILSDQQPLRRHLFVRHLGDTLSLTDRESLMLSLPADEDGQLGVWAKWEQHGIKIRPRALMTTMYARLVLCDLFIHGIGGAKYDEVTDAIIRRSMDIEPPRYLTATATVQLPLDFCRTTPEELQAAQHEAHELKHRAERYLNDGVAHWRIDEKRSLLQQIPPRGEKLAWHNAITRVNDELHLLAAARQQQLDKRVAQLVEQLRLTRLLGSREFSFCLFPSDFLRNLLLDLSRATP